jgi:RNA polymerase sigma-70 factor (ECF subfamily)
MALRMPSAAPAPTPVHPGPGRAAALPRDPGRATEALYRSHGTTVFRFAWHLLGRREDAEDATQATFLAVHRALASGTAILEPGAWVLAIARNECMGRLRRVSRTPFQDAIDGVAEPVADGSVESAAELRDEMRVARRTLSLLPEPQRDAFVLREWLGLETTEVSLALGIPATEVEQLTGRARRSLVLAVGGLEPAIGCAATRTALEAGSLDRAGKVHMLRCPVCRGVRRALQADGAPSSPGAKVHARLAGLLPGFGAGGGALATLAAKTTAAPVVTKAAALIIAGLVAGGAVGEAVQKSHPAHHRSAGSVLGRGGPAAAQSPDASRLALALLTPAHGSRAPGGLIAEVTTAPASRGGGSRHADGEGGGTRGSGASVTEHRATGEHANTAGDEGGKGSGGDHSGRSSGDAGSSGEDGKDSATTHRGSGDGKHAAAATGKGGDGGSSDRSGGDVKTASVGESGSDTAITSGDGSGDASGKNGGSDSTTSDTQGSASGDGASSGGSGTSGDSGAIVAPTTTTTPG